MSASLHLAKSGDLPQLLPLVRAFHADHNIASDDNHLTAALEPLLDGAPHGAAYLIGPARAPIGYLIVSFGWSVEFGGLDAFLDELYLRPSIRGRGIGTESVQTVARTLAAAGVRAMHLEVMGGNARATDLYKRLGFAARDSQLMTRRF